MSQDLRDSLEKAGISKAELGRRLGVAPDTAKKWGNKNYPVPQYAIAYLDLLIEYQEAVKARESDGLEVIAKIVERMRGKP